MAATMCAIDTTIGGLHIKTKPNHKLTQGVVDTALAIFSTAKGAVDLFGVIAKSMELVGPMVSKEIAHWTDHMGKTFSQGRNALSLPYFPTVLNNFYKDPSVRNGLEVGKIGSYVTALFFTDHKLAGQIAKGGGAAGTLLDAVDLSKEIGVHNACAGLSGVQMNDDVRKVVDQQQWLSAVKISKLVMTLFAGIAATSAWMLGLTLPASVATAAIVASLGALLIGFYLSYSENTTEWGTKISVVPVTNNPV